MEKISQHISHILSNLPSTPGVYQMFEEKGVCIYVGKAKNLKKRVSSYFQKTKGQPTKVKKLVELIKDISYTEVHTELEALILESNFIKELHPKFNVLLRDDKHYCYIKITTSEDYPRIQIVRKVLDDGAFYFGPKTSAASVYEMLKILRKLFPYRSCDLEIKDEGTSVTVTKKTISYPCLYYHIQRCLGPCVVPCKSEYHELISQIIEFLKGNHISITSTLEKKMKKAAEDRKFELALKTRDMLKGIDSLLEKQIIDQADIVSQDVIAFVYKFGKYFITLFQVRNGKIIGKENFIMEYPEQELENPEAQPECIVLEQFLWRYYQLTSQYPEELLLPIDLPNIDLFSEWLSHTSSTKKKIQILYPQKGKKHHLLQLAEKNAESFADQKKVAWLSDTARTKGAMEELGQVLGISETPKRIECYDISHLGGTHTVASMVVFKDGSPSKKDYRRFQLESIAEGQIDDFSSMKEVLSRRFAYLQKEKKENPSLMETPQLIVIDGGKGQLSSVMSIAREMNISHIPIISLAKREEEVFLPEQSNPIILPRDSFALYLLQNIRDEAHRFAISYNRNLRIKSQKKSVLDSIKGIGPKAKKDLLKQFGDIHGIKKASFDELSEVIGSHKASLIQASL